MKALLLVPMTAALLALPTMAQSADGKKVQKRVTVERNADGDTRRTVERRGVQRRVTDDGVTVRRGKERRVTTRQVTDDGVKVRRTVQRKGAVRHPGDEPTLRQKYHQIVRKLHARGKNAIENGARPKVIRYKVNKAKKQALRRLKASH